MSTDLAPTRSGVRRLHDCQTLHQAFESAELLSRIEQSMPKHLSAERMLRAFVQAANKQPDLFKCDWRQVIGACLTLSQIGLEPNTPLNHAYLIPFKAKFWNPETRKRDREGYDLQIVLGYPGLADLMWRTGIVSNIHAGVAYRDEVEMWYGTDAKFIHRPKFGMVRTVDPDMAYAHVEFSLARGGTGQAFEVMGWDEVLKIRNRSQAYQSAVGARENAERNNWGVPKTWSEAPWVRDLPAMAAKTAFRRLWKYMPKSPDMLGLAIAADMEDRQDAGRSLDFSTVIDGDPADGPADRIEHQQTLDPLAAHGMRTADPVETKPATQAKPAAQSKPAAQPKAAQAKPAAQTKPPADTAPPREEVEWVLFDGTGDVTQICPDGDIWFDQFTDIARDTPEDMRQAFVEFNESLLATALSPERAGLLREQDLAWVIDRPEAAKAAPETAQESDDFPGDRPSWSPPTLPPVPLDRRQAADQKKIEQIVTTALSMCSTLDQIDQFIASLRPEWNDLSGGAKLVAQRAMVARRSALTASGPAD